MQQFKYETHSHTFVGSKCAKVSPEDLVRFYKSNGYSGIFVTEHFLNGNTTIPADLPWEDRILLYCGGFERAYEEGKKLGMDVFFGWEYSYRGTDFLTYGLDKQWLLEHPDLLSLSVNEYCAFVRAEGGFIVHAHPFREAGYIDMIRLLPRLVDAVEVNNACRTDFENERAEEYAEHYDLLRFAGSDNHWGPMKRCSGIQLSRRLQDEKDMIRAVRNGEIEIFTEQHD